MTGLLLCNLGTPDAPDPGPVRRYLHQFLWDPRVLDINPVARALLLYLVILPIRPYRSAAAYRKIWGPQGSPLLRHSLDLLAEVRNRMPGWSVHLAMRYGTPSIESALRRMREEGVDRVVVLPLYPQYSSASTGSTVEEVCRVARRQWVVPELTFVGAFYDDPGFLAAYTERISAALRQGHWDHVLFSFHGLPERHMLKADDTGAHCLKNDACCDAIAGANRHCYRAQCFATARILAGRLGLGTDRWSVSFQSRLGRTPWIKPYTDLVLPSLAGAGKKRVLVVCPAFVADCLETVEEIAIRGKELFLLWGGESLELVPSLNAIPAWADAVVSLAQRHAPRKRTP